MGKRGPKPAPTALKLIRGESRPSRVGDPDAEVKPPIGDLERPAFLSPAAKKIWDRLAPSLIARGLLTPWDEYNFAVLCTVRAQLARAIRRMDREGLTVPGALGGVMKNPLVNVEKDLAALNRQYSAAFGLTPADRNGLKIPERPDGQATPTARWTAANILDH